jgi:hypothetical protein
MGMQETMKIIKELGGQASAKEIKQKLRQNYSEYSYAEYLTRDLRKLRHYGKIEFNETTRMWYIKE